MKQQIQTTVYTHV